MRKIRLDIPVNILIDTAGDGTYGGVTIKELVRDNTSFWMEGEQLWTETFLDEYVVTGTVNGEPYEKTF